MVKAARVELVGYEKTGGGYYDHRRARRRRGGEGGRRGGADRRREASARSSRRTSSRARTINVDTVMPLGQDDAGAAGQEVVAVASCPCLLPPWQPATGDWQPKGNPCTWQEWSVRSSPRARSTSSGLKLLVVRHLDVEQRDRQRGRRPPTRSAPARTRSCSIAAGSSARQTEVTDKRPVDAVIMAIVDTWDVGDAEKYKK